MARWLAMVSRAPTRWRAINAPAKAVVPWYRLLHDYTIPKSMRSPGEGPINQSHIPYIYPTVKLKCWCGDFQTPPDGRRRCSKPQH
eukprot:182061-Pyramimonas_sp.AAC.1